MNSLIISNFEAERFYISESDCQLPSITTIYSRNNICSLDEMQFVFAGDNDCLATQIKINDGFKEYLYEIGFNPVNLYAFDSVESFNSRSSDNIFKTLQPHNLSSEKISTISNDSFAFEEQTFEFAGLHSLKFTAPGYNIIKRANSKAFSSQIAQKIFHQDSHIVYSSDELMEYGQKALLTIPSILIKSEFGVSGKGSLKIDSVNQLTFMVKHLKRQENKGYKSVFIVERFLNKKTDFSTIASIHPDFTYEILSMQTMQNAGNSFNSIVPIERETMQILEEKGYSENVARIMDRLIEIGYFGSVCIDSMILEGNEIAPLVEINARKSMSFIYKALLKKYNFIEDSKCIVSLNKLLVPNGFDLSSFFNNLKNNKLLFTLQNKAGIIPLSPNGLIINSLVDDDPYYQANLYIAFLYRNNEELGLLEAGFQQLLSDFQIKLRQ